MHAIDLDRGSAELIGQAARVFDADGMGEVIAGGLIRGGEVVVAQRGRNLPGDVLIKRSAKRHIDDLNAAANGEEWLVISGSPSNQLNLDRVSIRIGLAAILGAGLAIVLRIDVDAARQKNAIKPRINLAKSVGIIREHRNQPWHCPR